MYINFKFYMFLILLLIHRYDCKNFQHGKYLKYNFSIAIFKNKQYGPQTCAKQCVYWPECKSFDVREFGCKINFEDESTAGSGSTIKSTGAVYGERIDATSLVKDACSQNTCPNNHRCVPLKNSGKACIKIVCASAPPTFQFASSDWTKGRSEVGTVVNYTCNNGYRLVAGSGQIICRGTGDWKYENHVCQSIASLCPNGYRFVSSINFCFKVIESYLSQTEANAHCQNNSGKLVSVDTEAKFTALRDYLQANNINVGCFISATTTNGVEWLWGNGNQCNLSHVNTAPKPVPLGRCLLQLKEYWYYEKCAAARYFTCEIML